MKRVSSYLPLTVRTQEKQNLNNTVTTKRTYAAQEEVAYPQLFELLAPDQKRDARRQMQSLPLQVQQNLLDEWRARCVRDNIRHPAAYLFGMIKKARAGEFRVSEILQDHDAP